MDMSWHLEVIRATRPDGSSWWFWCGAWLGGAAGDRRVMDAAASNPRGRMVDYRVSHPGNECRGITPSVMQQCQGPE